MHWNILTGEYPPQGGGVSDYSQLVAQAFVLAGDEVHVWASPCAGAVEDYQDGVIVHRLPDHFGWLSFPVLRRALARAPSDMRVLVQYVPHAFGWKAMNLPFCVWLWYQSRRYYIDVMFHEVAFPWSGRKAKVRHNLLAAINRMMAFFVARAAGRIYVSIPAWKETLRPLVKERLAVWLPVPSNVASTKKQQGSAVLREDLLGKQTRFLVGHFGTFGRPIVDILTPSILKILVERDDIMVLLVGSGSTAFTAALKNEHPALAQRLKATGQLQSDVVCNYLTACDFVLQPYPDGVSTRRGTVMASLACGVPILTTAGHLTESIWAESNAVCLANSASDLPHLALSLLDDHEQRIRLSTTGRALYDSHFCLSKSVAAMRFTDKDVDKTTHLGKVDPIK